jgi:hypothetical protein
MISAQDLLLKWLKDIVADFDAIVRSDYSPTLHIYKGQTAEHVNLVIELALFDWDYGADDPNPARRMIMLYKGGILCCR